MFNSAMNEMKITTSLKKAKTYFEIDDYSNASSAYQKILEMKPDCYEALNNLGLIMQSQGKIGKAEVLYRQAMNASPDSAEAYNNLANIANLCGRPDKALDLYTKATNLKPDYYEAYFNYGTVCHQMGQAEKAIDAYKNALSINPGYLEAHCNLGIIYQHLGQTDEALSCFDLALGIDPKNELALHLSNSLRGSITNTAPANYVKNLFDGFAKDFEEILVDNLEYSIPEKLRKQIDSYLPHDSKFNILDLGCGTGLVGQYFNDIKHLLVGVDLSKEMVKKTREKNIYDELYAEDILVFLNQQDHKYKIVIAADVFVYLGDLRDVFLSVSKALSGDAFFIFSIEKMAGGSTDYELRSSGRFAHTKNYIEKLVVESNLSIVEIKQDNIRKENQKWIEGYCCILKRR